jgi:hypothetical protein
MAENLVQLAERFLHLSTEIEDVRRAMLACLANSAGPVENPPQPVRRSDGKQPSAPKASKPTHPARSDVMAKSAAADDAVLALLRSTPGLRTAKIARATEAKTNTLGQRLQRLSSRGQVQRDDSGGWAATSPP